MSTLGHQYDNSLVSNAFGFLRLPMNFQPYDSDADWVITGVPFDMATSGRAGGRHGPAAIRQVSTNLAWEHNRFPWNFDMRERLNVVDCGDLVDVYKRQRHAAVGINDDFTTSQTAVTHRATDNETTGRVDEAFGGRSQPFSGQNLSLIHI